MTMRTFRSFSYKDTNLKVACELFDDVVDEIVAQRKILEQYIRDHPFFATSLVPVELKKGAPEIAAKMHCASQKTGLGPMASVAGTLAQCGVEKAMAMGCSEAIVENGGDMFLAAKEDVLVGIHSGDSKFENNLAFRITKTPVAICSSSSRMGHSLSFGNCGLATVVSSDAALADSAATLLCNTICRVEDISMSLEKVGSIDGIDGALAILDGRIGLFGSLPPIVKNQDGATSKKVTRDKFSI